MAKKHDLKSVDKDIAQLIAQEYQRQQDGMELIPSENIVSPAVREAMGSILTNKYSEGYPHRRYYGGQECIDQIEDVTRERAKKLFDVPHVNVQPYSGSPANLAVYVATCQPGDTIMGQGLMDGGHLTHGWRASATSMFYNSVQYHVAANGKIDIKEVEKLAKKHKPKLIWVGATAYPHKLPFRAFARIAKSVGAYLVADIAHVAGLVVAGAHPSPAPYVDIITTTTHKTLRGPRGGMIMVTKKGLRKDPDLAKKIDRAVFPMLQGGPHNHQTAALAVALKEASTAAFRRYGTQVVTNAQKLAQELVARGVTVVGGKTENHLLLVDCGKGRGALVEIALDAVGITVNKNTIPNDPSTPFYPSGIRIGTPSVTTRGMRSREMVKIAAWIAAVMDLIADENLPEDPKACGAYLRDFRARVAKDTSLRAIRDDVRSVCQKFIMP
jgi:glycine hydroxymethyltransferase